MANFLFVTKSQRNRGSYWRGWYLGTQLARMGHDFTLICPAEFGSLAIRRTDFSTGFRVITLPRLTVKTILPGIVLRTALAPFAYRTSKMDIVHVCAPAFPETYAAASMARLSGRPLVVDVDDWWGREPDGRRSAVESRLEDVLEHSSVSKADSVIAASEMLRDKIQPHSRHEVKIIPNGIDVSDFEGFDFSTCRKELLGRLELPDGSRIVIAAYDSNFRAIYNGLAAVFENEMKNTHLLVAGLPPEHLAGKNMTRMPKLERREWLRMIAGSDVVLMPMLDTVWERARFPIKLAEYMAAGRPIVSSSVGESRRIMAEAGYRDGRDGLFSDNTVESVFQSIRLVMDDPLKYEQLASTAKMYAARTLSWETIASDYLKTVGSLLGS